MQHSLDLTLARIRHYASKNGRLAERRLERWLSRLPADDLRALNARKQGRQVRGALGELRGLARKHGAFYSPLAVEKIRQANAPERWSREPEEQRHLAALFQQGVRELRAELSGVPCRPRGSSVRATDAPHRIDLLEPAPRWTLLIDESGSNFKPNTPNPKDPQPPGRFVGLLFDDATAADLPKLERFHGVDALDAHLDETLQEILDRPIGIMGITVDDVPETPQAHWQVGVFELIDWVLKLLPTTPEEPTTLEILIEQRGAHEAGEDWGHAAREIERKIGKLKRSNLCLDIRIIAKGEHPHLAYADAIAYAWGSTRAHSRTRLEQTELLGACLIEEGAIGLSRSWDKIERNEALSVGAFLRLAYEGSAHPDALEAALLARLGDAISADGALWSRYLRLAEAHLESKSIHLPALGAQFDFLQASNPNADLPPRTQLAWEAGRIARDNHYGEINPLSEELVEALSAQLFDEDAPLACLSDLQRAVAATNAFDFDGAEQLIRPWLEHPIAVPGLQMHGRVLSSLGQIHAFRGEHAQARARFEQALSTFERLSDPRMRQGEKIQTGTYRIISYIDDESLSTPEVRAALAAFFEVPRLDHAIAHLAKTQTPLEKYAHHALLRFLVQRGDEAERRLYLERMDPEAIGYGHPWPLTLLYRALLLREVNRYSEAQATLDAAIQQTLDRDHGPTLTMIGATLMALSIRWGSADYEEELRDILGILPEVIPHAARRVEVIRAAAEAGDDLAFIQRVLPFNFR